MKQNPVIIYEDGLTDSYKKTIQKSVKFHVCYRSFTTIRDQTRGLVIKRKINRFDVFRKNDAFVISSFLFVSMQIFCQNRDMKSDYSAQMINFTEVALEEIRYSKTK
jgi:hypothetical protein